MATCHYENQSLLCFCTQLSAVGANEASLTLSVQQIFWQRYPFIIFSPRAHNRVSSILQKHHLLELLMKERPRLTHWHFIVGHDDYISTLCLCRPHQANCMSVFSSCGQSPVWPCISAYAHSRVTGWGHDLSAFVYERQTAQACKITYFMQLVLCCTALQFVCYHS